MNDATHAQQPAKPGEHLRPTMELRWLTVTREGEGFVTLQQKWISSDAERYEWRSIPEAAE